MLKKMTIVASLSSVALLAGCAQTPRIAVAQSGILPAAPASFALAEGTDAPVGAALSTCLTAHGFAASAKPTWLALVTEADRPRAVGALGPEPQVAKGDPKWLPGTAPDKRPVRSLTFVLIRAGSGEEAYRLVVSAPYRASRADAAPDLATTACTSLFAPD